MSRRNVLHSVSGADIYGCHRLLNGQNGVPDAELRDGMCRKKKTAPANSVVKNSVCRIFRRPVRFAEDCKQKG